MKKFIFMMAALAAMVMSAHTLDTKVFDNTYLTVKGGVTALMHPGCNGYEDLGHTFEAATGLEFGKWVTPHWGFSIDGTNGWTNGSKYGIFQDEYAVNYLTVAALAKYRIPFGKFNMAFAAGPMWIHGFKKDATDANDMGAKMKIEFNFDLTKHLSLQAAPELNYNMRHVDWIPTNTVRQPYFDSRRAWYGLMIGVTYKIGKEFTECDYRYTQAEFDALNSQVNELRSRQPETKVVEVEKVITKEVNNVSEYVVFFDKNSAVLSNESKATLDKIEGKVIVKGCASEDGTLKRNNELSQERANAVTNYLTNRGVKVLSSTGVGVTGNRVAIVTIQ